MQQLAGSLTHPSVIHVPCRPHYCWGRQPTRSTLDPLSMPHPPHLHLRTAHCAPAYSATTPTRVALPMYGCSFTPHPSLDPPPAPRPAAPDMPWGGAGMGLPPCISSRSLPLLLPDLVVHPSPPPLSKRTSAQRLDRQGRACWEESGGRASVRWNEQGKQGTRVRRAGGNES